MEEIEDDDNDYVVTNVRAVHRMKSSTNLQKMNGEDDFDEARSRLTNSSKSAALVPNKKRKMNTEEKDFPEAIHAGTFKVVRSMKKDFRAFESAMKGFKISAGKMQAAFARAKEVACDTAYDEAVRLEEQWAALKDDHDAALEKALARQHTARIEKENADSIAEAKAPNERIRDMQNELDKMASWIRWRISSLSNLKNSRLKTII